MINTRTESTNYWHGSRLVTWSAHALHRARARFHRHTRLSGWVRCRSLMRERPLSVWSAFVLMALLTNVCLAAILRRPMSEAGMVWRIIVACVSASGVAARGEWSVVHQGSVVLRWFDRRHRGPHA